jgi:hypothetical protein
VNTKFFWESRGKFTGYNNLNKYYTIIQNKTRARRTITLIATSCPELETALKRKPPIFLCTCKNFVNLYPENSFAPIFWLEWLTEGMMRGEERSR